MNLIFPVFYLVLILIFLIIILRFVLLEIFPTQNLQKQLNRLTISISLNNSLLDIYLDLGEIYLKKQKYSEAIEIFRKCLQKWNKQDKVGLSHLYTVIGFSYWKLNFCEFAQFYLENAILTGSNYKVALNNLGYIYESRNLLKKYIVISKYKDTKK